MNWRCTPKLKKVVEVGDRIAKLHEVCHLEEQRRRLFEEYVNTWLKLKREASGCQENVTRTSNVRQAYMEASRGHSLGRNATKVAEKTRKGVRTQNFRSIPCGARLDRGITSCKSRPSTTLFPSNSSWIQISMTYGMSVSWMRTGWNCTAVARTSVRRTQCQHQYSYCSVHHLLGAFTVIWGLGTPCQTRPQLRHRLDNLRASSQWTWRHLRHSFRWGYWRTQSPSAHCSGGPKTTGTYVSVRLRVTFSKWRERRTSITKCCVKIPWTNFYILWRHHAKQLFVKRVKLYVNPNSANFVPNSPTKRISSITTNLSLWLPSHRTWWCWRGWARLLFGHWCRQLSPSLWTRLAVGRLLHPEILLSQRITASIWSYPILLCAALYLPCLTSLHLIFPTWRLAERISVPFLSLTSVNTLLVWISRPNFEFSA